MESSSALYESALRALPEPDRNVAPWLAERRSAAAARLRELGFPNSKEEAWRFVSLRELLRLGVQPSDGASPLLPPRVVPRDSATLVLTNGRWAEPSGTLPSGLTAFSLARALRGDLPEARHLMRLSFGSGDFVAQNDASFVDAALLIAAPKSAGKEPLFIVHGSTASAWPTVSTPRLLVVGGAESEQSIVEVFLAEGENAHLQTAVTEVVLEQGARLDHVRVVLGRRGAFSVGTVEVEQQRDTRYTSRVFSLGGTLTRLDLRARLLGPGAECTLEGLYTAGAGEQVDHHTRVVHESPRATSHQTYKGVVREAGHVVFDGTVVVRRDAGGTDAHQKKHHLLLAEGATVHAKPHLEIDTDDVKCSHGATVGRLDEAQVFYLRSRGISESEARTLLVDAFAAEMIDRLPCASLRDALRPLFGPPGGTS